MKFKSSIGDGAFIGLMVLSLLTLSMYIVWVITTLWWPAVVLSVVLLLAVLPVYFGTNYVLDRDSLILRCGFLSRKVQYRDIISVTDANCLTPSYALSFRRICLRYLNGDKIKIAYLSPSNRDAFRDSLNNAMQKSVATLKSQGDSTSISAIEAVEEAKEKIARERELTRAEERAINDKTAFERNLMQESLAKEIKKLDEIIDGNLEPDSVVLSQEQEDLIASRRNAERKLLAKVRKLKAKKERAKERELAREKRKAEEAVALSNEKVVWEKPKKEPKTKKTADDKFADKEREKAKKIKDKENKTKQKLEKIELENEQDKFETTQVFVEENKQKPKPKIEKVKAGTKDKMPGDKTQKAKIAERKKEAQTESTPKPKLTKEEKISQKKFAKDVKIEAKRLKKEAQAEAKAEKKSSAEQLAKQADKAKSKKTTSKNK